MTATIHRPIVDGPTESCRTIIDGTYVTTQSMEQDTALSADTQIRVVDASDAKQLNANTPKRAVQNEYS